MTVNVGLVGFGYWGPNLARNFGTRPDCALRWICDQQPARLANAARLYPATRTTEKVDDLIQDPEVDLILVATPVSTHYPLVKQALEADKDVLVEKPLALSVKQAEELVELAERRGRILAVDHTFLYTPAVRKIKDLLDAGELGDLLYFDSVRVNLGLFQHDVNVLWDLAPHDLSILGYLHPEQPTSVIATGASHTSSQHTNQVYLHLDYGGRMSAHFHWNWMAPVKIRLTSICGRQKMIVYDDMEPTEKVKVYDKGITEETMTADSVNKVNLDYRTGDMIAPKLAHSEALAIEAEEIVSCVRERRSPRSDGAFALKVIRVMEAAEESLRGNGARIVLGAPR